MKKIIPTKKVCKLELGGRPKFKTDTIRLNKWILRIIRTAKQNKLYELGIEKKKSFLKKLMKTKEKYLTIHMDIEKIKNNLIYNVKKELITELKQIKKRVEIKLNVEERLFVLDQIEKAMKKRIEYMKIDKRKMLNSILKKENKKINIDCLIINRNNDNELILNENEILQETNKHFKSITDTTLIRDKELDNYWNSSYIPREDIDKNIYNDLLTPIIEEE